MPWVKLDDAFAEHPKILRAGGDAGWLHVCALCWCQRRRTGGRLPKHAVMSLSDRRLPNRLARRLVESGLWEEDGDDYVIHDFADWNSGEGPTGTPITERNRKAAQARWSRRDASKTDAKTMHGAMHDASKTDAKTMHGAMPPIPNHVSPSPSNGAPVRMHDASRIDASADASSASGDAPEKETDQGKPQVSGPVAERWEALFPRRRREALEVLGFVLSYIDELLVDEAIGHCVEKPPKSPRYLLTICADWAQQRGANLSEEALAALAKGPT